MRTFLGLLAALCLAPELGAQTGVIQFENGQWFDGKGFKKGTMYSVNGVFSRKKPAGAMETVDLGGGYVVPPFGDADVRFSNGRMEGYLRDGIFYTLVQEGSLAVAPQMNTPRGADVAIAATVGQGDLERVWTQAVSGKPDMIRVLLGPGGNLPQLPDIVRRAYAAKLRVAANPASEVEYREALRADVDMILGVPAGLLTKDDVRGTARRRIQVVASAQGENAASNLRALKSQRVEMLLSGSGGSTALAQAASLRASFTNLELLKMLCEVTPRAIFPARRIGYLMDSYEASFVVLKQNPLSVLPTAQDITHRFKQGNAISPGLPL